MNKRRRLRRRLLLRGAGGGLGATPATVTPVASPVLGTDTNVYTFTNLDIPAGLLLIGQYNRGNGGIRTVQSLTVDGEAATLVDGMTAGAADRVSVHQYQVAEDLTGVSVVVTLSGNAFRCGIDLVSTNGSVDSFDNDNTTAAPTATLNVPALGAVYAYAGNSDGTGNVRATWTGATEHTDETIEGGSSHSAAAAQVPAGGSTAITCTWASTPSLESAGIFVAIAPP